MLFRDAEQALNTPLRYMSVTASHLNFGLFLHPCSKKGVEEHSNRDLINASQAKEVDLWCGQNS